MTLYYYALEFSPFAQMSRLAWTPTSFLPRENAGEDEGGGLCRLRLNAFLYCGSAAAAGGIVASRHFRRNPC